MSKFKIFHYYNRLVRRGAAEPLTCETCQCTLILSMDALDEPVLKCFPCNRIIRPGQHVYDQMKRIIEKYENERA